MATRTDAHRPATLVTEDYEYLFAFDNQQPGRLIGVDMDWWRSITNWDPSVPDHRGTHQCHHCGAYIRYVALLRHLPTGYALAVGETCLENRFELASTEFHKLRKAAELDRKAQGIKTAAAAFVAAVEDEATRTALAKDADLSGSDLEGWALDTFTDIRRKLWYYGDMSAKQLALVVKLVSEATAKKAQAAARQAERDSEVTVAAPVGRVEFTGKVVSLKFHDNDFGGTYKITVKVTTPEGVYLVWVSKPSGVQLAVGVTVTMTATLTRSDDKAHFAFGKRPSKASVVAA